MPKMDSSSFPIRLPVNTHIERLILAISFALKREELRISPLVNAKGQELLVYEYEHAFIKEMRQCELNSIDRKVICCRGGVIVRIVVSSLKFSPGHLSHIIAYAKLFSEMGNDTKLWLHEDYKKLIKDYQFPVLWYPENICRNANIILFANVSTKNHIFARNFKKEGTRIIYLYHEPWDGFKQYLKEGVKQTIKATVAHYFSIRLLQLSDLVIVPSKYAFELYKNTDIKYNTNVIVIPLLFDNEMSREIDPSKKTYLSYVGHAVKGHAFDVFIDFVKYIYKNHFQVKVEIATRTDLTNLLERDRLLSLMVTEGVLRIAHGRPLTNEEINEAYERSFCVWNIYRRSTQSGVLPKAFMFGTPVLASNIGSFPEYVRNGENGFLVERNYTFDELLDLVVKTKQDIQRMAKSCRETFETTFYWRNYLNSELVERIRSWQ